MFLSVYIFLDIGHHGGPRWITNCPRSSFKMVSAHDCQVSRCQGKKFYLLLERRTGFQCHHPSHKVLRFSKFSFSFSYFFGLCYFYTDLIWWIGVRWRPVTSASDLNLLLALRNASTAWLDFSILKVNWYYMRTKLLGELEKKTVINEIFDYLWLNDWFDYSSNK